MSDIKRAIETLKQLRLDYEEFYEEYNNEVTQAYDIAIASLETDEAYQLEYEQPEISKGLFEQIKWERDIAIEQLKELGYEFGEKIEPTTKNDLGISSGLENVSSIIDWNNCHTPEQLDSIATTKNDLGVDKFDKAINQSDLEEWIMETFPDWCLGDVRLIMNHMDEMPPVTPIRPKGHWIETAEDYYKAINEKGGGVNENTDYFVDDIACSECFAKFSVIDNEAERFDFCPCCGSDNREVVEE